MMKRLALLFALGLALAACGEARDNTYQGWVEADMVFVGPDEAGRLDTLSVREGDTVTAGQPLFSVDDVLQQADVAQAKATLTNARLAFERAEKLLQTKAGTQANYDNTQAAVRVAEATLNSAQTRLARRKVTSPAAGIVQEVYFRQGEMVPAGRPVVALLPPANLKVRFFVPQDVLPRLAVGDVVHVSCDGCALEVARISFIARSAEYTPPVIYSLEERKKLVFLVEARPNNPERLRVGQPVSVAVSPATPVASAPEAKK